MSANLKSAAIFNPWPAGKEQAAGFAKRILVVDPDQQAWEVRARLLIAQGYVVRRIGCLADAPPRWPRCLYDLVVISTEEPARPEIVEFCQKLGQVQPPVRVVLLTTKSPDQNPSMAPIIFRDRPAAETAADIARLLR